MSDSPPEPPHEIEADLDSGLDAYVAEDLAALEHLLARHAAFADYCRENPRD